MRAVLTAVIAAIEAVAVALAGLAIVAVPALLMWWLTFSLSAEVDDLFATIAGIWLLAHFVPLGFDVTAESALSFGLAPEPLTFTLSLAPLGLTLLTVALAFRSGWRFAERGGTGAGGVAGGTVGFAVAAVLVVVIGAPLGPWPMWAAVLVPALCYGVAVGSGFVLRAALTGHGWWRSLMRGLLRRLEWLGTLRVAALPGRAAEAVRIAAGSFAALIGLAALGVTIALVVGYIEIITLSQGLQLDPLGLIALFLLNLALLPVALVWAIAWLTGGGFAIGAGTSVTPFETLLGPLPVFPLFGAVPQGWGWAGGLAPALIVLLGVTVGVLAGARPEMRRNSITACLVMPFIASALVGLAVTGLAALATGSIGPDRLAVTGPQPWLTGGLAAVLLFIGLVLGVLARRLDVANRLLDATKAGYARSPEASPVDPIADPAAETRELVPFERVRPESAAQAETVELEPAPREHADPVPPSDPVLPSDPVPPSDADTTPHPAPDQVSAQDPESAQDPLLEAFSWENSPERERGEPDDGATGWRPPWRKR